MKFTFGALLIIVTMEALNCLKHFPEIPESQKLQKEICAIVKREVENHPEIKIISIVIGINDHPQTFVNDLIKCLPSDVSKVIIIPPENYGEFQYYDKKYMWIPKSSLNIYISQFAAQVSHTKFKISELFSTSNF